MKAENYISGHIRRTDDGLRYITEADALRMVKTIIKNHEAVIKEYEAVLTDQKRLIRRLDVALNGVEGAAQQASLCDIVAQIESIKDKYKP